MMGAMRVKFMTSGKVPKDYPFPYKPEIAIVGRSNAGKSSFINALTNSKIAKVSGTPGKTRLLNFFDLDDKIYMVDMPGYGFAKGDQEEVIGWKNMIETYLAERETLKGVVLIMDIRREWANEEQMISDWFTMHDIRWTLVLNKSDKLSRSAMLQKKRDFQKKAGTAEVFALSSMKKEGLDEVRNVLFKDWPK